MLIIHEAKIMYPCLRKLLDSRSTTFSTLIHKCMYVKFKPKRWLFFFYIVILNFKSSRNEIFDYRGVLTLDERNPMVKFRPLGDHQLLFMKTIIQGSIYTYINFCLCLARRFWYATLVRWLGLGFVLSFPSCSAACFVPLLYSYITHFHQLRILNHSLQGLFIFIYTRNIIMYSSTLISNKVVGYDVNSINSSFF